jgi:hypothetical protein
MQNAIPNLAQADILKASLGKHGILEILMRGLQAIIL